MASGHVNRIKRPNTWLHRPMLQNVKKALANTEPSTHGTNRTSGDARPMVAIRGKADIILKRRDVPVGPGADISGLIDKRGRTSIWTSSTLRSHEPMSVLRAEDVMM